MDGKSWNVSNNALFQARFEKYLNAPAAMTESDNKYQALLVIMNLLAPRRVASPLNLSRTLTFAIPLRARFYSALAFTKERWQRSCRNGDVSCCVFPSLGRCLSFLLLGGHVRRDGWERPHWMRFQRFTPKTPPSSTVSERGSGSPSTWRNASPRK